MGNEVLEKRKLLQEALADKNKYDLYLGILKSFFAGRLTKEEMNYEAAKLLTLSKISFHNQFFSAMMEKIAPEAHLPQAKPTHITSPSLSHTHKAKVKEESVKKKSSPKKMRSSYREIRLRSAILAINVPRILPSIANAFDHCSLPGSFPDTQSLHGGMYAYAFASELDEVPEACALYMAMSIKQFIKTILLNIFSKRSAVRLRSSFPYSVGACHINRLSQNANFLSPPTSNRFTTSFNKSGKPVPKMQPIVQWSESQAAAEFACDNMPCVLAPVNLRELYDTLITKSKTIPVRFIHVRILELCIVKLQESNFN